MNNINSQEPTEYQDIDIKYWLFKILGYWYFFVIVGGLFLTVAHLYLRYTEKTYRVQASLLINDGSGSSNLSTRAFSGTGRVNPSLYQSVDTEIAVLTSFDLIRKTLDSLNFRVSYFKEGQVKTREVYSETPIRIELEPDYQQSSENLYFEFDGLEKFNVLVGTPEKSDQNAHECRFGEVCKSSKFSFVTHILDSSNITKYEEPLFVRINDLDRLTVSYLNRVVAVSREQENRFIPGSIVDLTIGGSLIEKNTTFLNALCQVFINHTLREKNIEANNTIEFIDRQLNSITDSLTWVELALENYRASKGIIDLSSKGELVLTRLTDLENQKSVIELNQKYYIYLSDYFASVSNSDDQIVSPASVGITDPSLAGLIMELNELLSRKVVLEVTLGEENLNIQAIHDQINSVKGRLQENVKNLIANSQLSLNQINQRLSDLRLEINELPRNERELLTIQRKFNVNNELFTFLLKQKAESEIARAANTPNIRMLDRAREIQASLISPRSSRIYLVAGLASFVLVLAVLLLKFFLNDKISDISQLQNHGKISILTDVPYVRSSKKNSAIVRDSPRGRLAEAFRNLRINLDFVVPSTGKAGRVVGVTSAASGEGKTFCAINLSYILALAGKKTLLIGLDLRKPRIQQELSLQHDKGLSSYLINSASLDEIIQKSDNESLDIISSGPIPPNPTELIENGRLEILLEGARKDYDYIIVDGPPMGLVTDYMAAAPLFQTTLFVLRMNYSKLQSYRVLQDYVEKGILKSSHLIVNGVPSKSSGKHGYGYYTEEEVSGDSFLRRLFGRKNA